MDALKLDTLVLVQVGNELSVRTWTIRPQYFHPRNYFQEILKNFDFLFIYLNKESDFNSHCGRAV